MLLCHIINTSELPSRQCVDQFFSRGFNNLSRILAGKGFVRIGSCFKWSHTVHTQLIVNVTIVTPIKDIEISTYV